MVPDVKTDCSFPEQVLYAEHSVINVPPDVLVHDYSLIVALTKISTIDDRWLSLRLLKLLAS